jgi:hypothetical protein
MRRWLLSLLLAGAIAAPTALAATPLELAKQSKTKAAAVVVSAEAALNAARAADKAAAEVVAALEGKEEPPVEGKVLWKGDGSQPLYEQWSEVSDQEHCALVSSSSNLPDSRIFLVNDARFSKGNAVKFVLRSTDSGCYTGRTELGTGNPTKSGRTTFPWVFNAGDEAWFAMEAAYPANLPPGGLIQLHEAGGPGSPPFGFGPGGNTHPSTLPARWEGHIQQNNVGGGPVTNLTFGEPVQSDTVYRIVMHAKFELTQTGFVEVFIGPKSAGAPTLVYSNHATSLLKSGYLPTHVRVGNYIGLAPKGESILYLGGFSVATTRAAAEAAAF